MKTLSEKYIERRTKVNEAYKRSLGDIFRDVENNIKQLVNMLNTHKKTVRLEDFTDNLNELKKEVLGKNESLELSEKYIERRTKVNEQKNLIEVLTGIFDKLEKKPKNLQCEMLKALLQGVTELVDESASGTLYNSLSKRYTKVLNSMHVDKGFGDLEKEDEAIDTAKKEKDFVQNKNRY